MGHRRISNKRARQMMSDIIPDDFNQEEDDLRDLSQESVSELPSDNEE